MKTINRLRSLGLASLLIAALGLCGVAPNALAQGAPSAAAAASIVQASSQGRVLGVKVVNRGGRKVYRVKVLTQRGVVRVVTVQHSGS
jgi:hypothetical protein